MAVIEQLQDFATIRAKMIEIDCKSHTTDRFQEDLVAFASEHAGEGTSMIEIGCYKGGLTAQLALVAKRRGQRLDVIDIDHKYLNIAAGAVAAVGLSEHVDFHAMDFAEFVRQSPNYGRASLVFDDGDHRYEGVVADIRAVRAMPIAPYACAFHDFSLRYAPQGLSDVRVDKAIYDEFGADVALIPIGERVGPGGTLRLTPAADSAWHYHEIGQSEGVIVKL